MAISLVSFGLFGPALSTTNINIVNGDILLFFLPFFFCSLNWEFSYSNWEKNILFGIGNTTEYRSSKRAKKNPDFLFLLRRKLQSVFTDMRILGFRKGYTQTTLLGYRDCIENLNLASTSKMFFFCFLFNLFYLTRPSMFCDSGPYMPVHALQIM